jgi:hypothetical protein
MEVAAERGPRLVTPQRKRLERVSRQWLFTCLTTPQEKGVSMVARNRIRCLVVAVPVGSNRIESSGAMGRDVLPWADPYVAGLIKKLQDEVRHERRCRSLVRNYRATVVEQIDGKAEGDMLFAQ